MSRVGDKRMHYGIRYSNNHTERLMPGPVVPFWLGQERDPEKVARTIERKKKYEALTKMCRLCGKIAFYQVKLTGYCEGHKAEAYAAARANAYKKWGMD